MSLRGDITDFPLTEIVQIISVSQQTGTLVLNGEVSKLSISFRSGKPILAGSAGNREKIGELLLKGNEVNRRDIIDAMLIQKNCSDNGSSKRIGKILIEMGTVSPQIINKYLSDQIVNSLYDILSEKKGTFEFNPEEGYLETEHPIALDIDELIIQGIRHIDDRAKIKDTLLSAKAIYHHNKNIVDRNAPLLANDERLVLSLVDGTRSIEDVVNIIDIPNANVKQILYKLISMSYLEFDNTPASG